jgi:pantothenate kinase
VTPDCEALTRRALGLTAGRPRALLGITGPPGAGKSTLAADLVRALDAARPGSAVLVGMDGFHLAGAELDRLGRADRKGAPDTFDVDGFVHLLRRLRTPRGAVVYAPAFCRQIEEPVAGAVAVPPEVPLVVVEGNYLLLDTGPWAQVRDLLDEVWFLELDDGERVRRLVDRHVRHGRSRPDAERFVARSDQANARLVAPTAARADLLVRA